MSVRRFGLSALKTDLKQVMCPNSDDFRESSKLVFRTGETCWKFPSRPKLQFKTVTRDADKGIYELKNVTSCDTPSAQKNIVINQPAGTHCEKFDGDTYKSFAGAGLKQRPVFYYTDEYCRQKNKPNGCTDV